jgi:uncharacterized protein
MATMTTNATPVVRELDRAEMEDILSRNHIGRVAYSYHDRVSIVPVHYVYSNGWIYGRTSPGGKLDSIKHNWWVAFEVDEVDTLFDWRSVVVHGGFFPVDPERATVEREAWTTALGLVRTLVPDAFKETDPTPGRSILFRIAVQELTGRTSMGVGAAVPGEAATRPGT